MCIEEYLERCMKTCWQVFSSSNSMDNFCFSACSSAIFDFLQWTWIKNRKERKEGKKKEREEKEGETGRERRKEERKEKGRRSEQARDSAELTGQGRNEQNRGIRHRWASDRSGLLCPGRGDAVAVSPCGLVTCSLRGPRVCPGKAVALATPQAAGLAGRPFRLPGPQLSGEERPGLSQSGPAAQVVLLLDRNPEKKPQPGERFLFRAGKLGHF